jgi:hypothetical protein
MTLGRKIHHGMRLMTLEQRAQRCAINDVDLGEGIPRMSRRLRNGCEAGRIGELIDIDDEGACVIEQIAHHRRSNEARAAGDKYGGSIKVHVDCPFFRLYRFRIRNRLGVLLQRFNRSAASGPPRLLTISYQYRAIIKSGFTPTTPSCLSIAGS